MRRNWKLQFGVGSIMFAMLLVAGYFYGLNRGDTARYNTTVSSQTYSLAPLLTPKQPIDQQLNAISHLVQQTIAPDSWIANGGTATLTIYEANRSMIVSQNGTEHDKIANLLELLEKQASEKTSSVNYDVSAILNSSSAKPVEDQIQTIASLAAKKILSLEFQSTIQVDPDPANATIAVTARESTHSVLTSYFNKLRSAREEISKIDG